MNHLLHSLPPAGDDDDDHPALNAEVFQGSITLPHPHVLRFPSFPLEEEFWRHEHAFKHAAPPPRLPDMLAPLLPPLKTPLRCVGAQVERSLPRCIAVYLQSQQAPFQRQPTGTWRRSLGENRPCLPGQREQAPCCCSLPRETVSKEAPWPSSPTRRVAPRWPGR